MQLQIDFCHYFVLLQGPKGRINYLESWWSGNETYSVFFIASCTLLQRYIEFNKLLQKNVLTYYACLFIGGTLLDISKSFDKTCCDGLPYEYVLKYDGFYFNKFSVAKSHHSILSSGNCQFDPTPNSSCDYHYYDSNTDET